MVEQLWSDDRIEQEVRRIGDNMRLYIDDACTVAEQIRDDLQAKLDAANETVAELEASFDLRHDSDMRAIKQWQAATGEELKWPNHADLCVWLMQRIAELEAQLEWEPVIYSTFIDDDSHDETYLLATLGGTQLEIGTDPTSGGVTVNLPKEYRLFRRKEGR